MSTKEQFLLVANWKMHFTPQQAAELYLQFTEITDPNHCNTKLMVAAPAPALYAIYLATSKIIKDKIIPYGSQNIYHQTHGAYTGEISAEMLTSCGASFSLTGHSERRTLFLENDELIHARTKGALEQAIDVILCIGETLEERENGTTNQIIEKQLILNLPLFESFKNKIIIAYEPVWAIGTGKVATLQEIKEAHAKIKSFVLQNTKYQPQVLYGGSVKPDNISEISKLIEVDGALVGGASLKFDSFTTLYKGISN